MRVCAALFGSTDLGSLVFVRAPGTGGAPDSKVPGQGAIRVGKWKLLHGHTCQWFVELTQSSILFFAACAYTSCPQASCNCQWHMMLPPTVILDVIAGEYTVAALALHATESQQATLYFHHAKEFHSNPPLKPLHLSVRTVGFLHPNQQSHLSRRRMSTAQVFRASTISPTTFLEEPCCSTSKTIRLNSTRSHAAILR